MRLALGASRWRLIRQLFGEGLLLAGGGALSAMALASLFGRYLVRLISGEDNRLHLDLSIDGRVLLFITVVAISACVLFGVVPAFRSSRMEPGVTLRSGSRGATAGRHRFAVQQMLVVSQIAVSLVLLVGGLLFVRSFRNLMHVNPGFREKGIVVAFLDMTNRENVVGIVLGQTLVLLAFGVVVGVVLALAVTRSANSLLFGLTPNDPLTFLMAVASLFAVALIAVYVPAARAFRLDPLDAFRYD